MVDDFISDLLPVLGRSLEAQFNVFDVMHHGLHEKQISNVFRWLLNRDGSHRLDDRFVQIFIEEVNDSLALEDAFATTGYWVRQEQNTTLEPEETADIADLVLESAEAVLVIENYFTSDGHGHDFLRYLAYGRRHGKRAAVVMLCRDVDRPLLTEGWQQAAVVTYSQLANRLHEELRSDTGYRASNADAYSFIEQLRRTFDSEAQTVEDRDILDFVVAMCDGAQADRYGKAPQGVAAQQFGQDVAAQATRRFEDGRALMQRVKDRLQAYVKRMLVPQLDEVAGPNFVRGVTVGRSGMYVWTIDIQIDGARLGSEASRVQLKFGPSAWHAVEADPSWRGAYSGEKPDYSEVFMTLNKPMAIRRTGLSMAELMAGVGPEDTRLRNLAFEMLATRGEQ